MYLRWYLTLQGDNAVKSAKRFNDIVLLREYLASQCSKLVFVKLRYNQCKFSDKTLGSNFLNFLYFCKRVKVNTLSKSYEN